MYGLNEMKLWCDRDGLPIGADRFSELIMDDEYRVVAHHREAGYLVSTVWSGLDPRMADPPAIFETMILGPDRDDYQDRYATERAALAGHDRAIAYLRREILGRGSDQAD